MIIVNKDEFLNRKRVMVRNLEEAVFIYPTDTIYGIGCDATNPSLVDRIRNIKEQFDMPFSVIAPSKEWIEENCVVSDLAKEWLEKLPGPYTLILSLKNKDAIAENVNLGAGTIGVRMPDNWFMEVVSKMNVPIVTTSANLSGDDFMTSTDNLNPEIGRQTDMVIDQGELNGAPSTLVFLNKKKIEIRRR